MLVAVMREETDHLIPVLMKMKGKQKIFFFNVATGVIYSPHIRLKEVNPNSSIKMHRLTDPIIPIGELGL